VTVFRELKGFNQARQAARRFDLIVDVLNWSDNAQSMAGSFLSRNRQRFIVPSMSGEKDTPVGLSDFLKILSDQGYKKSTSSRLTVINPLEYDLWVKG